MVNCFLLPLNLLLSKKDYSFTDIWNIVTVGNDVFFRSKEKIFQYNGYSITVYPAPSEWAFLGIGNNTLIAQDLKNGLMKFNNGLMDQLPGQTPRYRPDFIVSSMFSFGTDSSFLTTITSGFYVLNKDKLTPFPICRF